jgi:hypothetical protein
MDNNQNNYKLLLNSNTSSSEEKQQGQEPDADKENTEYVLGKCDNRRCGKKLVPPFYILLEIPPGKVPTFPRRCMSLEDERNQEEDIISRIKPDVMQIYYYGEYSDNGNEKDNEWIFSKEHIMKSKKRLCYDCWEEFKYHENISIVLKNRVQMAPIVFSIEEYQRRYQTDLDSSTSEAERYIVSLPDRSNMLREFFGSWMDYKDSGMRLDLFKNLLDDFVTIALTDDYDDSKIHLCDAFYRITLQDLCDNFLHEKHRRLPNDKELIAWIQKHIEWMECYHDPWFKIQRCKIFENPHDDGLRTTKYTVVIHFSAPKGYWLQYDI